MIRIGVDVRRTKIEAIAIDPAGVEMARRHVASPAHDYAAMVEAVRAFVAALEGRAGRARGSASAFPGRSRPRRAASRTRIRRS